MSTPRNRVVVLTGSSLRHEFFRKSLALAEGFDVVASICEGKGPESLPEGTEPTEVHLAARMRSEEDFFGPFVRMTPDRSHPRFIDKGMINDDKHVAFVVDAAPSLIVAYGCSIIRGALLQRFAGRIVNIHLGLSPYYRGSGTNFWALVNGEPESVGATFMYMDAGIDTGAIIHQIRARVFPGDGPHQIGNRLIADAAAVCIRLVGSFDSLSAAKKGENIKGKIYKRRDFTSDAVRRLYARFEGGLVGQYLAEKSSRIARVPITSHPLLRQADV